MGAAPVNRTKVTVKRGGQEWNGHWEVEGDKLFVVSAYGWRTVPAGAEKTRAARAEKLMGEIVIERTGG
jgi:hypothetical protein